MAIYPAIWREYLGTQIKTTFYNEDNLLLDNKHFFTLPYKSDGTNNFDCNAIPRHILSKMCKAIMESSEYYGIILINSTYLCRVADRYTVTTDLFNADTNRENTFLYLAENKEIESKCEFVGFERTWVPTPEVFCGYSRILQNTETLEIYYNHKWHDYSEKLQVCNSRAKYQEFMKTSYPAVVYSLDGIPKYIKERGH